MHARSQLSITLQAIDQQLPRLPHIPIHIVLGDFAASPYPGLVAFAAARWDERYGFSEEEARIYIERHLADGDALLLLDALDETVIGGTDAAANASYGRVLKAIEQVATQYRTVPIVVTARKAGYAQHQPLSGFIKLEVLDFRHAEIKAFVQNWFQHHPMPPKHATADELIAQIDHNPRIQALATNPLLLCLIVLVYELRQHLPEKRAEIYKQCVDTLLSRWDTSRDIRRRNRFQPEQKYALLTHIAWHFHVQGRRYFPENELLQVIGDFLPTIHRASELYLCTF